MVVLGEEVLSEDLCLQEFFEGREGRPALAGMGNPFINGEQQEKLGLP